MRVVANLFKKESRRYKSSLYSSSELIRLKTMQIDSL